MRYKEEHTSLWCDRSQRMATTFVRVVRNFHNYNHLRIKYARINNSTPSWAYTQADMDGCFHLLGIPSVWSSQELYLLNANQCMHGRVAYGVWRKISSQMWTGVSTFLGSRRHAPVRICPHWRHCSSAIVRPSQPRIWTTCFMSILTPLKSLFNSMNTALPSEELLG